MRTRLAVTATSVALLVAACGSNGHSPTSSTSSTSSATGGQVPAPAGTAARTSGPGVHPGEQPPVLAAVAAQRTPAGAEAFARYFIQALDWSVATNDAYLLLQISAATCTACQRDIHAVSALRQQGIEETGGRLTIIASKVVPGPFKIKSDYTVEIITNDESISIVRPGASPSVAAPAVQGDESLVFVSWIGGRWRIVEEGGTS